MWRKEKSPEARVTVSGHKSNTFLLIVTVRLRTTFHLRGGEILISKAATGVGDCSELRVAGDGKSLQPGCVYKTLRNANATLTENQNSNKRQKYLHIVKLNSCKIHSRELFSYIIHSVLKRKWLLKNKYKTSCHFLWHKRWVLPHKISMVLFSCCNMNGIC